MQKIIFILIVFSFAASIGAQTPADSTYEREALAQFMGVLNLQPGDIGFRSDYTEIDPFRLKTIGELMSAPYGMIEYGNNWITKCSSLDPGQILNFALEQSEVISAGNIIYFNRDMDEAEFYGINTFYSSLEMNRLLMQVRTLIDRIIPEMYDSTFSGITKSQKQFIVEQFKDVILEDTSMVTKPVELIDSISQLEEEYIEQFVDFADNIRKEFLIQGGIRATNSLYEEIERFISDTRDAGLTMRQIISDTTVIPGRVNLDHFLGKSKRWKIAGPGNDRHRGDYDFIFDLGGDDYYDLTYNPRKPHPVIIIDLSGNDTYRSDDDFAYGSGCLNVGLLFDMAGNDNYNAASFSLGSGYFGFGLLYDKSGSDIYNGDIHTEGAATFGVGLLLDASGHDTYNGRMFAQGVGLVEGVGLLVEGDGNDNFFAGGKYPEGLGLAGDDTHYLSLSQGFAYGLRPFMSGGIGAIIDLAGKDNYVTDIYGQGASYWWGLGMICDLSGYDQYVSHQYAQGTGVHMSLGMLFDQSGNDFYRGKGLMQGVGHDYACGIIVDRAGDDIYQAHDLSQAAGSANGIGILLDDRGNDTYYIIGKEKSHGYGNPRRDFGSLGLFLDLSGKDIYTGYGGNDQVWKTDSKWGGGFDFEFIIDDTTGVDQ